MTLDNLIKKTVGGASGGSGSMLKPCHRVTTKTVLGVEKTAFKQGGAPRVQIRTEKRKNHNVTIVQGLERYGYDLEKVSKFFQQKFGANSFVEDMSDKVRVVGIAGFFDRTLEDLLASSLGVPEAAVENTAENKKAGMKEKKQKK